MRWPSLLTATMVLSACVTALAQGPTYQLGRTQAREGNQSQRHRCLA